MSNRTDRPMHILVAVDLGSLPTSPSSSSPSPSPSVARPIAAAREFAGRFSGEIDLLHVHAHAAPRSMIAELGGHDQTRKLEAARSRLDELRGALLPPGLVVRCHVRIGDPADGIIDAAEQLAADVIVVGSDRSAASRALLGSVGGRVVRGSSRPVWVVSASDAPHVPTTVDGALDDSSFLPAGKEALSCARCGHIRGALEPHETCYQCGLFPSSWLTAPIVKGPIDADLPAVGQAVIEGDRVDGGYAAATPDAPPGGGLRE